MLKGIGKAIKRFVSANGWDKSRRLAGRRELRLDVKMIRGTEQLRLTAMREQLGREGYHV